MRLLILLSFVILTLTSCKSEKYLADVAGQTLGDNESLFYDNYRYTVFNKTKIEDQNNEQSFQPLIMDNSPCIESCYVGDLKIAVIPMSLTNEDALKEIKNTVMLVEGNASPKLNKKIKIIDNTNLTQDLSLFAPHVIVGPFLQKDIKVIESILKQNGQNIPILSLARKADDKPMKDDYKMLYNMNYRVTSDITSVMDILHAKNYSNFIMLTMHDNAGTSQYNEFTKIAKQNKQNILRTEFYQDINDIEKYTNRLGNSTVQYFYQNTANNKINEDDFSFTKNIADTSPDGKGNTIVTMKDGKKYYKKSKKIDAIIIDATAKELPKVISFIAQNKSFTKMPIILTPRAVDALIETKENPVYSTTENPIMFASHYSVYSAYYNVYKNTFGKNPTKASTTLYETLTFALKVHEKIIEPKNFTLDNAEAFVGLNGTMVLNGKNSQRFVNISKMQRGDVEEIVDTYQTLHSNK